jgi:hypothetical protein
MVVDAAESTPVHSMDLDGHAFWSTVADAIVEACGSQKAAAITLRKDQAQFSRELHSGRLSLSQLCLELGPQFEVAIAKRLIDRSGPLAATPAIRLRQMLREVRRLLDEAEQAVDHIAEGTA